MSGFQLQGVVEGPDADTERALYNYVGPGFLRTLGIPLPSPAASSRAADTWNANSESRDCQRGVSAEIQTRT